MQLIKQSVSLFKEKLALYIMTKDVGSFFPIFYIFGSLMRYISPFELMELVDWMFHKIHDNLGHLDSKRDSTLPFCFYVANVSLEMFYDLLHQTNVKSSWLLWDSRNMTFSVSILQNIFLKILEFAVLFKLDSADLSLLKAVNAIYRKGFTQVPAALPSTMELCRITMSSPMKLITHCIYETNKVKARTLFELIEVSPLHLSLFGMSFLGLINELSSNDIANVDGPWPPKVDVVVSNYSLDFSDENLVILLPAALSYLTSVVCKFRKQDLKLFGCISSFYSRIILKGFSNWKDYCSGKVFYEDFEKYNLRSVEHFFVCFSSTLLGKTIHMLHLDSILRGGSMKKKQRLSIFASIFESVSSDDQLFHCDAREINPHLCNESFNLINRVVAKISFATLLLFHPGNQMESSVVVVDEGSKELCRKTSSSENCAKLRFLNILFDSLGNLVRRFPWKEKPSQDADCSYMLRFLEVHILRNIIEVSIFLHLLGILIHSIVSVSITGLSKRCSKFCIV